jgi:hypothetical protein
MSKRSRDRLSTLSAPKLPGSPRRSGSARAPGGPLNRDPGTPFRCYQTGTNAAGERIFAIEGGHLGTGGMTESELRQTVENFEGAELGAQMRAHLEVIKRALEEE